MNPARPTSPRNRNSSRAWIFRLTLGVALVSLGIWGIPLCKGLFRASLGPGSLPTDASFANLAATIAWLLFFGPVAAAGVAIAWSTLRKMDAFDPVAFWLHRHTGISDGLAANHSHPSAIILMDQRDDRQGLESLSAESVKRLHRIGTRTAVILGGLVGAFLLAVGIFGLVSLLFFSRPSSGASVYPALLTARIAIYFAVASGISVLLGLAILQRTFRRENTGWLIPLQVFTRAILRNRQPDLRAKSVNRPPSEG
jgi:hypothetical protein